MTGSTVPGLVPAGEWPTCASLQGRLSSSRPAGVSRRPTGDEPAGLTWGPTTTPTGVGPPGRVRPRLWCLGPLVPPRVRSLLPSTSGPKLPEWDHYCPPPVSLHHNVSRSMCVDETGGVVRVDISPNRRAVSDVSDAGFLVNISQ